MGLGKAFALNLALLIDGENVPAQLLPELNRHVASLGDPIVRCVFGDFSENRLPGWIKAARDHCLELVFQLSEGKHKNSADIALTIRAMDLLYSERIDGFCLVSSDRDFAPLTARLRQHGKKVYGFGEAKANDGFRANFNEFFLLETNTDKPAIAPPVASSATTKAKGPTTPTSQIVDFIRKLDGADAAGFVHLSMLAAAMRRDAPDLAAQISGKGKFLKNLKQTGKIEQDGTGGAIRVRLRRPA
ncbi:NYN domain-containing protein [Aquamicrobium soli]|uniref:NYN domain-containing protein n=1 Tax=Aquamicrobium soli TaxID=1811518 RepID=A0ABV7KDM3_9HYPH